MIDLSTLATNLWICGGVIAVCWLLSVISREYSWTDRLWSVTPVVFAWVFAAGSGDARAILLASLITLWGVRLTLNFARRGGYAPGGEDYRWAILRERMPGWAYAAFNVVFIAGFQNALLLAITLPVGVVAVNPAPLGWSDAVAAVAFLTLLAFETVADQQRWNFHRANPQGGVLRTGLYRFSRHPNYFGEIGQWWVVFVFALVAAGAGAWPWGAGAGVLTALFLGSTAFTEQISRERHAGYAEYRRETSMLVPWPPARR